MFFSCRMCDGLTHHNDYIRYCHISSCLNENCDAPARPYDVLVRDERGELLYASFSNDNIIEFNIGPKQDSDVIRFIAAVEGENGQEEGCFERGEWERSTNITWMKKKQWYIPGFLRSEKNKVKPRCPESRRDDHRRGEHRRSERRSDHRYSGHRSEHRSSRHGESSRRPESRTTYYHHVYPEYTYPDDYRGGSSRHHGSHRR